MVVAGRFRQDAGVRGCQQRQSGSEDEVGPRGDFGGIGDRSLKDGSGVGVAERLAAGPLSSERIGPAVRVRSLETPCAFAGCGASLPSAAMQRLLTGDPGSPCAPRDAAMEMAGDRHPDLRLRSVPASGQLCLTAGDYLEPMSALGQLDSARLTGFHVLLCDECAEREGVGNDTRDVDLPDGVTFRAVAL